MRRTLDYRDYDPANYGDDHPSDPAVQDAQERARQLAEQLQGGAQRETGEDRARYIEQGFDQLQSDQADLLDKIHADQRHQLRENFLDEHRYGLEAKEQEWLKTHHDPTDQVVYREQMNAQTRTFEESVRGGHNEDFNARQKQLEHKQGAQLEYISHEIGKVQDEMTRGMEPGPGTPNAPTGPTPPGGGGGGGSAPMPAAEPNDKYAEMIRELREQQAREQAMEHTQQRSVGMDR